MVTLCYTRNTALSQPRLLCFIACCMTTEFHLQTQFFWNLKVKIYLLQIDRGILFLGSHAGKTAHAAVGRIALTMCLAAASGGITQTIVSGIVQLYNRHENYNTNEIANAVLANLVAVTGCCPFIEPGWSILIGRKTILLPH